MINCYFCSMKWWILWIGALGLISCESGESVPKKAPFYDSVDGAKSESFGVEYFFSDSARVTAQLFSAHVVEKEEGEEGKERTIHYLDGGVRINFLNSDGKTTSKITSQEGVYDRIDGLAELTGSVLLLNGKGEKLETEQLFWDEKKDSIYTPARVRIETPERIIFGEHGMRANSEFTAWTILESSGEVTIDDE